MNVVGRLAGAGSWHRRLSVVVSAVILGVAGQFVHSPSAHAIVNGTTVEASRAPWFATIITSSSEGTSFCGGTLISPSWVLTAQHCFRAGITPTDRIGRPATNVKMKLFIGASTVNFGSTYDNTSAVGGQVRTGTWQGNPAAPFDISKTYSGDIALIRLSTPVTSIVPITLGSSTASARFSNLTVLGRGGTNTGLPSPALLEAQVRLDSTVGGILRTSSTGSVGGVETRWASGDSGGPVIRHPSATVWTQVGLVSGSLTAPFDGVAVRVDTYRTWIDSVLAGESARWEAVTGSVPTACSTTLTFSTSMVCSLTVAGEVRSFDLAATAGDVVRLKVRSTTAGFFLRTGLYSPTGTLVCPLSSASEVTCATTATGRHTVRVSSQSSSTTGSFSVWPQRLNAPVGCATTYDNASTYGKLAVGGVNCYTVAAAAGDRFRLQKATVSGDLALDVAISGPGGTVPCATTTAKALDCTLTAAGSYSVTVGDAAGPGAGSYELWTQRLNAPVGCRSATFSSLLTVSLAPGEVECLAVDAAAGDRLRAHVNTTAGTLLVSADVIGPDGLRRCTSSSFDIDCAAPTAGRYLYLLSDTTGPKAGAAAATTQRLNNPVGCVTLVAGRAATDYLAVGQVRCYRMSLTAGTVLRLEQTQLPTLVLTNELLRPDGTSLCASSSLAFSCTTTVTGLHTVTVRDNSGTRSGSYTITPRF